ncbi:MAG: hypothetical protein II726_03160 [Elusimicrobiaceae bacterium]|nr:hypothetical protein [Elusimicrobiaceae bacterium]
MKKFLTLFIVLIAVLVGGYLYSTRDTKNVSADNNQNVSEQKTKRKPAFAKDEENTNITSEQINSADFEIVPTMESVSKAKNQVYAGAFQLVWNDFMNELVKGPIKFLKNQPAMVDLLNKQKFTTNDIQESAYYKKWGEASPKLKKEIEDGIWEKFEEKSQILDSFDFTPEPFKYFLYVMMKKNLEYEKELESLEPGKFEGSETLVKYFGILEESYGRNVKQTIGVLFYNNDKDFAVTLHSKQGDLIHLYKVNTDKTLAEIYEEMKEKAQNGFGRMRSEDRFKAPKIDFNKTQEFKELYNKPIVSHTPGIDYWEIEKAMERIQFKMDEFGAKVVAEAGMMALGKKIASRPPEPRYFYFTGPYAIFIQEQGKAPYFAAYITDPSSIQ